MRSRVAPRDLEAVGFGDSERKIGSPGRQPRTPVKLSLQLPTLESDACDDRVQRRVGQLDLGKATLVTTPREVRAAAKAWYAAGACVIPPVHSGKKSPLVDWKMYQSERPNPETMASWYTRSTKMGVGILCGKVSG